MIYVLIGIAVICALAMVVVAIADDTVTVEPEPRCHPCHICGRIGYLTPRRRDTKRREWTCVGCHDEGTAWGWWDAA